MSTSTSSFLAALTGQQVLVKLYSGELYKGTLDAIDGYMNITLDQCEQVSASGNSPLSDVFIRGNNVLYIAQ